MNNYTLLGIGILAAFLISMNYAVPAFAQYGAQYGSENTGTGAFGSLEEQLELAKRKVETAAANPATGSGTPYLNADGIFGGIAAAFLIKGRSGRYAAYGRG